MGNYTAESVSSWEIMYAVLDIFPLAPQLLDVGLSRQFKENTSRQFDSLLDTKTLAVFENKKLTLTVCFWLHSWKLSFYRNDKVEKQNGNCFGMWPKRLSHWHWKPMKIHFSIYNSLQVEMFKAKCNGFSYMSHKIIN